MPKGFANQSIQVISDHRSSPLLTPDYPAFRGAGRFGSMAVADLPRSADADCAVFHLQQVDSRACDLALRSAAHNRPVVVVAGDLQAAAATALMSAGVSVIPAFGPTEHLGPISARRAVRRAVLGERVVARGFLEHSAPGAPGAGDTFLRVIQQASAEAREGTEVVAAVLAPRRSGSQYLRDLVGWTAGSGVRVFHEHEVPARSAPAPWPWDRRLSSVLETEPDVSRHRALRRQALGSAIWGARRRYFFVTDREPRLRILSLFLKRHSRWLRDQFDARAGAFRDLASVQAAFERWLPEVVRRATRWHRQWLLETFGLDVLRAEPTADGLLELSRGDDTLIVVPIERFGAVRSAVDARYGAGHCDVLDEDSAAGRGDAALAAVARRDLCFPEAVVRALAGSPEIVRIRAHVSSGAAT